MVNDTTGCWAWTGWLSSRSRTGRRGRWCTWPPRTIRRVAALGCGARAVRMKEWVTTRPRDLPVAGRACQLRWRKRRWRCDTPTCTHKTFTETLAQVPPGARVTGRLRAAAGAAVADGGRTIVQAARDLGLSWPVVSAAFTAHAVAVLPAQPDPVRVLGIDEIRRGRPRRELDESSGTWRTAADRWRVGFVDLSGGQGLLGQAEGRTTATVVGWLARRSPEWRAEVRFVAIDMCTVFKAAIHAALPHATLVVDHFHVVQLANAAVTEVRRRLTIAHRRTAWPQRQSGVGATQPADPQRRPDARRSPRCDGRRPGRLGHPRRADPDRLERQRGPSRRARPGPHPPRPGHRRRPAAPLLHPLRQLRPARTRTPRHHGRDLAQSPEPSDPPPAGRTVSHDQQHDDVHLSSYIASPWLPASCR